MPNELKPGETPWDALDRDDLLHQVQRMYSALHTAHYALSQCSQGKREGYWGSSGSGGIALEKTRQVVEAIETEFGDENVWRAFFRYADDLLFDCSTANIGQGWGICPSCGRMFGCVPGGKEVIGRNCRDILSSECQGVFRKIRWKDITPNYFLDE